MKTVPEYQSLSGSCRHLLGVDPHTPRCIRWTLSVGILVLLALTTVPISSAQENLPLLASAPSEALASSSRLTLNPAGNSFLPIISPPPLPQPGVDWHQLFLSSSSFLVFAHAFRYATEQGTRDAFSGPFLSGYLKSVGNMH